MKQPPIAVPDRAARRVAVLLATLLLAAPAAPAEPPVRRGLGPEPDSLDIHRAQGLSALNLVRDLREGLVSFDVDGEPGPGVAERWTAGDGGLQYEFTLRPDARWSDGTPVVAGDFVRAWRLALSPATAAVTAGLLRDVANAHDVLAGRKPPEALGIEAVGEHRLHVRLDRPLPWLPEILAHPVSFPLPPGPMGDVRNAPVNGPYVLAEWVPRSLIRLERNESFHSAAMVAAARVEYFPIEEPNTELARYRAGELDITETIPASRFDWLRENLPADLRISPYLGSFWLGLNLRHEALRDSAQLRLALAMAIDRATLVRVVLGAGEAPAFGIVPPGIPGYEPVRLALADASQEARVAEAKRLYAEAGYGPGRALRLELRYNTSGLHRRIAVAVAAMWKQVLGVHTELINEEWKVFVNNRRLGVVTQVFRGGWIADYADPTSFLDLFLTGNELNSSFHSDPDFDRLMTEAAGLPAPERSERLQAAETRLLETLPAIPLYYYVSRHLVRPGISGWHDNVRDIHLSRYLRMEAR